MLFSTVSLIDENLFQLCEWIYAVMSGFFVRKSFYNVNIHVGGVEENHKLFEIHTKASVMEFISKEAWGVSTHFICWICCETANEK